MVTMLISDTTISQAPVPASRPRVTKWGTYYPKTYKDWKDKASGFFSKPAAVASGPLHVQLEVICKRPQKLTTDIPVGDVDNYAKAALDAVNDAGIWGDDKQVVSLHVVKRYAGKGEEPRTHIEIHSIELGFLERIKQAITKLFT